MSAPADWSTARATRSRWFISAQQLVFYGLCFMLLLDSLEAYAFAGMPLPWLAMAAATPLIVLYAGMARLRPPPASGICLVLLLWMYGNTLFASIAENYSVMMPPLSTTPYPVFVLLRAYSFLGFLLIVTMVYNLTLSGKGEALIDYMVWLGVAVVVFAFYVFAAQRLGLPMPPKGRFATGEGGAISGGEEGQFGDSTEKFLFRTLGSFREPSFLGIWLVVPFFYSLLPSARSPYHWRTAVIGLGLLSTGSLTAAVALVGGFVLALQLLHPLSKRSLVILLGFVAAVGITLLLINVILGSYFYQDGGFSFVDQYWARIERILQGGIGASNRGYAFDKFFKSDFSLWGRGLGNAHLYDSFYASAQVPISYLSLYFHAWFAGGAVGLSLVIVYLLAMLLVVLLRRGPRPADLLWYVAAYVAWLIIFAVNDEAFNLMFSVTTGLMLARGAMGVRAAAAPPCAS
jgi:hypothetical protein